METLVRLFMHFAIFGLTVTVSNGSKPSCGRNFSGLHGRFYSPNYPQVYPDHSHCVWNIAVPKGYYISLNFSQFELEGIPNCTYDYVEILGRNSSYGKFCGTIDGLDGNFPRRPVHVAENKVSVVFHTDYSNEEDFHGFESIFVAHDLDECKQNNGGCGQFCVNYIGGHYCTCKLGYALGDDGKICIPQCTEMLLRSRVGVVQTPEYPNPYPPHADCDWTILSEAGYKIILEYDELDIESHPDYHCPYDYVTITTYGSSIHEEKVCGKRNATTIITPAVMIHYKFHSDDSLSKKGFRVRYRFQGIRCPKLSAPLNGRIDSPEKPEFKDIIRFHCNQRYRLFGKRNLRCTYKGSWDGTAPVCKLYSCGRPPVLDENTLIRAENFTINSTIYYGCRGVYSLQGEANRTCQMDGTWSGSTPPCKPGCGQTEEKKDMSLCVNDLSSLKKADSVYSPWLVSVIIGKRIVCTGAIIAEKWIVTAAHCVTNKNSNATVKGKHIKVDSAFYSNTNSSQGNSRRHRVLKIVRHPHYTHSTFNADIALLKLRRKIKMTTKLRPICLPSNRRQRSLFLPARRILVTGFSSPSPFQRNKTSPQLVQTCSFLVNRRTCNTSFVKKSFKVTSLMLCTPNTRNEKKHSIDFSGGLMTSYDEYGQRWILGGLTSWGSRPQYLQDYRVYTRMNKFAKWIKSVVSTDIVL